MHNYFDCRVMML